MVKKDLVVLLWQQSIHLKLKVMIQIKLREIILALFAAVGTAYEPTS